MAHSDYHFRTAWRVAGRVDEVTAILTDPESLPTWWPSVYLSVRVLADPSGRGQGDNKTGVGSAAELHTKDWLPYTLTWTLRITAPITPEGFALSASGDLIGTGVWTFRPDGPEVQITYDWTVRAAKPLLRRLSWLLKPAFEANHHWAMARGQESLALELRRRRATDDAARHRIPAPPPPTFGTLTRAVSAAARTRRV